MPDEKAISIPSSYVAGYEAARAQDAELAELYVRHTTVGDRLADEAVTELADVNPNRQHRIIAGTIRDPGNPPEGTPQALLRMIEEVSALPDWFDPNLAVSATRAFLRNSEKILAVLVGAAIIEGFSTMISKSFRIRSRLIDNGVRRLKQNLLQLMEQFLPHGMEPGSDGWKLSLRIRLVHARSRMLIADHEEWDLPAYGTPISQAHTLLGAAAFSGRLLQHVATIGGDFSDEEQEGYIQVWRWTGRVMGVPDSINFRDMASSVRAFEIGALCEPPPDEDSIILANSIINSAPILLGYTDPSQRRPMARYIYQVSRELIGAVLADQLHFPAPYRIRRVPLQRLRSLYRRLAKKHLGRWGKRLSLQEFENMISVSDLGQFRLDYHLPTTVYDEESTIW